MDPEDLFFKGNDYLAEKNFVHAEATFREAIQINPDFAEAHANLGWTLEQMGILGEAEACYLRSLALNPDCLEVYLNLGVLLVNQKRFAEAETAYNCALQVDPTSPAAWTNRGVLDACMKREAEAEHCYRTALGLHEQYAKARFNLSYLLLRQGRFEEGWAALEARDWYALLATQLAYPRWQGEDLTGKSLLIGIEAGHGDMIQFCRYASVLKKRGAGRVGILCHPALKRLFRTVDGMDTAIALDEPFPAMDWDFWSPPLSLPFHCKTRLDSIPVSIPYLHALPDQIETWRAQLPEGGLRVGLAWKGSPRFENDADRSLPSLAVLAPLASVPGVQFVSLQKGEGEEEAAHPPTGMPLLNLGPRIKDFADTAAIMHSLDLVITVDTAAAHLAGALGKPSWVLLPDYKTDWRWLTERRDSPWYPESMRLFRQSSIGDWSSVIQDVAAELERFSGIPFRQFP